MHKKIPTPSTSSQNSQKSHANPIKNASPITLSQDYQFQLHDPELNKGFTQSAYEKSKIRGEGQGYLEDQVYEVRSMAIFRGDGRGNAEERMKKNGELGQPIIADKCERLCIAKNYIKVRDADTQTQPPKFTITPLYSLTLPKHPQNPETPPKPQPILITSSEYCRSLFQTMPQKLQIFETHTGEPLSDNLQSQHQMMREDRRCPENFFKAGGEGEGKGDSLNVSSSVNMTKIQYRTAEDCKKQAQKIEQPQVKANPKPQKDNESSEGSIEFESDSNEDEIMLEQTNQLLDMTRFMDASQNRKEGGRRGMQQEEWRTDNQVSVDLRVNRIIEEPRKEREKDAGEAYRKLGCQLKRKLNGSLIQEFQEMFVKYAKSEPKFHVVPRRKMFSFLDQLFTHIQQTRKSNPEPPKKADRDTEIALKLSLSFPDQKIKQLRQLFTLYNSGYFHQPKKQLLFEAVHLLIRLCKEQR